MAVFLRKENPLERGGVKNVTVDMGQMIIHALCGAFYGVAAAHLVIFLFMTMLIALVSGFLVLLTFIPLYFAARARKHS